MLNTDTSCLSYGHFTMVVLDFDNKCIGNGQMTVVNSDAKMHGPW